METVESRVVRILSGLFLLLWNCIGSQAFIAVASLMFMEGRPKTHILPAVRGVREKGCLLWHQPGGKFSYLLCTVLQTVGQTQIWGDRVGLQLSGQTHGRC